MIRRLLSIALLFATAGVASAQPAVSASPTETTIREGVKKYVEAFNRHDAKALAGMWAPDAVYLNQITGEEVVGREAITKQFATLFDTEKELKIDVVVESVRLLSPNVAVEQGTVKLLRPNAEPEENEYTAVYVQRDGQWLLDRVTDLEPDLVPSHYEQLKVLEWMVGTWVDQDDAVQISTECHWASNQNFLVRKFTAEVPGRPAFSGLQIIGWDAAAKAIRSWTFDSDGGFAEATWTNKGGRWFIHNKGVLADGRKAAMVNVMKPVDENSFTWQTIERSVAGELLPNINEVLVTRQ